MRRILKIWSVGIAAGIAGAMLALTPFGLALEERFGLSWLFRVRGPIEPPQDVVVVSLDRESAERLGLPYQIQVWPRTLHAEVIDRLAHAGASVIVFDLIFSEPGEAEADQALARAIAEAGRVLLLQHLDQSARRLSTEVGPSPVAALLSREQLRSPLPAFAEAAAGLATFPLPRVPHQVSQFWAFRPGTDGSATLPAVALQHYAGPAHGLWSQTLTKPEVPGANALATSAAKVADPAGLHDLVGRMRRAFKADPELGTRLREAVAQTSPDGAEERLSTALIGLYDGLDSRYLNFYGPAGQVRTIPVHELLAAPTSDLDALDLAGRAVFVGQSDVLNSHGDNFLTVFSRSDGIDLSGVEIAATAFANLLDGRELQPAGPWLTLALLGAFGVLIGMPARLLPGLIAVPGVLALGALYYAGAQIEFARHDLWLPVTIPLLVQLPLALFAGLVLQYRDARRAKVNMARGVRYFLPEPVARQLNEDTLDPSAATEVVFATCLVSDAQRFTAFAETTSPQEVSAFLNDYFGLLFGTVKRHGGIVTDVVGDGTTCIWTSSAPDPARRRAACRAALEAQRAVNARAHGPRPMLPTRIGLHSGWVVLGNVGGSGRFVYSVIGDIVNTAARIETLNKQLHTRVLATRSVVEGLSDLIVRPLGRFRVVGKVEPLEILEIIGEAGDPVDSRHLCTFAEAIEAFRAEEWRNASRRFEAVLERTPDDGPSRFYLRLLHDYVRQKLPDGDPSVVTLSSK